MIKQRYFLYLSTRGVIPTVCVLHLDVIIALRKKASLLLHCELAGEWEE
jgi:hypothetical protein